MTFDPLTTHNRSQLLRALAAMEKQRDTLIAAINEGSVAWSYSVLEEMKRDGIPHYFDKSDYKVPGTA